MSLPQLIIATIDNTRNYTRCDSKASQKWLSILLHREYMHNVFFTEDTSSSTEQVKSRSQCTGTAERLSVVLTYGRRKNYEINTIMKWTCQNQADTVVHFCNASGGVEQTWQSIQYTSKYFTLNTNINLMVAIQVKSVDHTSHSSSGKYECLHII